MRAVFVRGWRGADKSHDGPVGCGGKVRLPPGRRSVTLSAKLCGRAPRPSGSAETFPAVVNGRKLYFATPRLLCRTVVYKTILHRNSSAEYTRMYAETRRNKYARTHAYNICKYIILYIYIYTLYTYNIYLLYIHYIIYTPNII